MREELLELVRAIDRWAAERGDALDCYVLGGASLRLFDDVGGHTKDLDFVAEPLGEAVEPLIQTFGQASGRDPWLDLVKAGLPVLPQEWKGRATAIDVVELTSLTLYQLAPSDLVASKLKAFRPHDRRDIQVLCDLYPGLRSRLAAWTEQDFWPAPDLWEERIRPHRDRVLAWMDGSSETL